MAQESPAWFEEGMNALVAGLERPGCLAEAEYMNAELFGNVPRTRGSLDTWFSRVLGERVTRFEDGTANSQVEGSDDDEPYCLSNEREAHGRKAVRAKVGCLEKGSEASRTGLDGYSSITCPRPGVVALRSRANT
jgi:hypothetical protein